MARGDGADLSHVRRWTASRVPATSATGDGRREGVERFHGAFEGGWSAGHFNSVGTADGWTPRTFRSGRRTRADETSREQRVEDFMDEDEIRERRATVLRTREGFDTFGDGARERGREAGRRAAERDERGVGGEMVSGDIGGSFEVADLLVVGEAYGIGRALLRKLGRARRRARDVVVDGEDERAVERSEIPRYVVDPKNDRKGLGYDAFAGAEEFRDAAMRRRRAMEDENSGRARGRRRGEAFGVSVFEEEDEALYDEDKPKSSEYVFELDDDDDVNIEGRDDFGARRASGATLALGAALPNDCVVRGFKVSSDTLAPPKWFEPPVVPRNYQPRAPVAPRAARATTVQPTLPPEAPAPADVERRKVIDTLATFVAKHGKQFEDMAKARQGEDDEKFSFLFGGRYSGYYKWKLAKAAIEANSEASVAPERRARPLGMEDRAKLLGEELLPSTVSSLGRGSTVTAPNPSAREPPARQKFSIDGIDASDRERIQKLLSKTFTSGGVVQSDKIEQVGLHVLEKNKPKIEPHKREVDDSAALVTQMPLVASRSSMEWAPEPLLCKRFGIQDPFANRARPDVTRYKFRSDGISLDATHAKAREEAPKYLDVPPPPPAAKKKTEVPPPPPVPDASKIVKVPPPPPPPAAAAAAAAFVEKPMCLFNAIFEDSDEEAEEDDNETEADVDVIKAALTKPDSPRVPAPTPAAAPVWSSAVMTKPAEDERTRKQKRERESKSRKRKKEKKEKKEKRRPRDERKHRKHRKHSRRDYDSSSSYTSD